MVERRTRNYHCEIPICLSDLLGEKPRSVVYKEKVEIRAEIGDAYRTLSCRNSSKTNTLDAIAVLTCHNIYVNPDADYLWPRLHPNNSKNNGCSKKSGRALRFTY